MTWIVVLALGLLFIAWDNQRRDEEAQRRDDEQWMRSWIHEPQETLEQHYRRTKRMADEEEERAKRRQFFADIDRLLSQLRATKAASGD